MWVSPKENKVPSRRAVFIYLWGGVSAPLTFFHSLLAFFILCRLFFFFILCICVCYTICSNHTSDQIVVGSCTKHDMGSSFKRTSCSIWRAFDIFGTLHIFSISGFWLARHYAKRTNLFRYPKILLWEVSFWMHLPSMHLTFEYTKCPLSPHGKRSSTRTVSHIPSRHNLTW